jgi:hypothetical protein
MARQRFGRQNRHQVLKLFASGACRTPGRHPDYDGYLARAARAELRGDQLTAMVLQVAAQDAESRVVMVKRHKPTLGPYTDDNPLRCLDCGMPLTVGGDDGVCRPWPKAA